MTGKCGMAQGRVPSSVMMVATVTTPARRRAARRLRAGWVALLGAATIVGALLLGGCGNAAASSTPATLGSVEATPDELALGAAPGPALSPGPDRVSEATATTGLDEATSVVAVDEAAAGREPIGPPLSPGSTAEQVLEVVSDLHGPTLDVAGQMNRLLDFPGVPTAVDTTIIEVRADVGETSARDRFVVTSEVVVVAPGSPEAHLEFYRSELEALGWTETAATTAGLGTTEQHRVAFEIPDTAYDHDDVELVIGLAGPDPRADGQRARVQLRHVEVVDIDGDGSPRSRLEGWVGDLPLPAGYEVTGAAIQTSDLTRRSLHFSLALRYEGTAPDVIATELRGALPAGGYEEIERPSMGQDLDTWVYLQHPLFDEARISPHRFGPALDPVVTSVNVNARLEF